MGVKKIARPINKTKNDFLKWLKDNEAEDLEVYKGEDLGEWDYYRSVSAFVRGSLYVVYFTMMFGDVSIEYSDDENEYKKMSIDDFTQLISN